MPGGYVGVDVFFVISGYLISKIIYKEITNNTFSFQNFYERRARRILPALISVVLVSSILAYIQFYPPERVAYFQSALASILFSANIYFYATLNYFSPLADQIALLHLWSLGIEEQFYIFFPFFVLFFATKSYRLFFKVLIFFLILSLITSAWTLTNHPNAAFYLLPFRAFELLTGSLIALPNFPRFSSKKLAALASGTGFLIIIGTLFIFNEKTSFPGFLAMIPCLSTALIIWSGEKEISWPNKILSLKPITFIGKLSYSLYLVHWPIIVFFKRNFPHSSTSNFVISVLILMFILATTNFYLVEQRFRKAKHIHLPKRFLFASLSIVSLFFITSTTIILKKGFPNSLHLKINKIIAYLTYDAKANFGPCFQDYDQNPQNFNIAQCLPQGENKIILWGDSQAIHLYAGLKDSLSEMGYSLGAFTYSACSPLIDYHKEDRPFCKKFNEMAISEILKAKPKALILSASWILTKENIGLLEKTIQQIHKQNIKIILLGISPRYKQAVPLLIAEQVKAKKPIAAVPEMLELTYLEQSEKIMEEQFNHRSDVQYISVMKLVCPDNICPLITMDETPVHFDVTHLTTAGSKLFAQKLLPEILSAA